MRGHPYRPSRSLRIHSISHAARLCLLARFAPRPAPRAAWRIVMPPFSPCIPLLVPSGVQFVHRFPLRLPAASCLLPPVSCRHGSRLVSPPATLLSHRPSPRRSCRGTGRHNRLACRHAGRLCLLGVVPFLSKNSPRQSFKNLPRKTFKNFHGQSFKDD